MNEENEIYYDYDDEYEDMEYDDEYYNQDDYYLTDQELDDLIDQILKHGSKHTFHEIEAFLCSANEIEVYEWKINLSNPYANIPIFSHRKTIR